MPYLSVPGSALYYEEWGPPDGRPLLLLHAALQTGESMEPLRRLLAPLGYRMAALDQRGHGRSANPTGGFTMERLADDASALLDRLGWERPAAIGYSLGGSVAVELARRGRLSALVVLASRIEPSAEAQRTFEPDRIRRRMPGWVPQLQEKHLETPWEDLAGQVGSLLSTWKGFSSDDLASIACPTLVVQGDKDEMVPLSQGKLLASSVRGARLVVVPHARHPELLYRTDAMKAVAEFLG